MKTIQITMDEDLLAQLDRDEETKRSGRSAVLRRAVAEYLKRRNQQSIAVSYRRAYGTGTGLGPEFEGWEAEGQWPKD
jgi:metal-responsive CopG/Arc/MetJ family transcriptional regulator